MSHVSHVGWRIRVLEKPKRQRTNVGNERYMEYSRVIISSNNEFVEPKGVKLGAPMLDMAWVQQVKMLLRIGTAFNTVSSIRCSSTEYY